MSKNKKSAEKSPKKKESKKAAAKIAPAKTVIDIPELETELKRLNRVSGQVEGIKRMLSEKRALGDVLIQCKAVHSALKAVEGRLMHLYVYNEVEDIMTTDKKKERAEKLENLLNLYKHV